MNWWRDKRRRADWIGGVVGVALAAAILIACAWVMMHQTPVVYF